MSVFSKLGPAQAAPEPEPVPESKEFTVNLSADEELAGRGLFSGGYNRVDAAKFVEMLQVPGFEARSEFLAFEGIPSGSIKVRKTVKAGFEAKISFAIDCSEKYFELCRPELELLKVEVVELVMLPFV